MKVAIYARVSTSEQTHDSQLLELRQYCERRGWKDVLEITDKVSGARVSRQGLDQLMGLVRRGKLDAIVCFKLDRLGRSLSRLAQLIGELDSNRVALIVPGQGIDTSADNPAGRLQLHILACVAEFERSIIRDRVNAGIANARAKGVQLGRPEEIGEHAQAVAELHAQGLSGRAIAKRLGIPASNVHRLLRRQSPERVAA